LPLEARTSRNPHNSRPPTVVTIGNFDGVHAGHTALLARARELAAAGPAGTRVVALVFDPHPLTRIDPERAPERLTTFEQRTDLLGAAGVQEVVRLEPTGHLLGQSPEEFIGQLVADLAPIAIVEGPDFRFGRGRAGDIQTLCQLGRRHGFEVSVVEPVAVALSDHTLVTASSSITRWQLRHGRVRDAALVLLRPYEMEGLVVAGDRRGRRIGIPTANLDSPTLIPADGVYAGTATLPDGSRHPAAISVGNKPQFGGGARTVEAHILRLPESQPCQDHPQGSSPDRSSAQLASFLPLPGLPEYGWRLRLTFEHWLRDQARFESVESLKSQIARDCGRALDLLAPPAPEPLHT
jgi:riboflavin kinase/FMN adenylyltransferase